MGNLFGSPEVQERPRGYGRTVTNQENADLRHIFSQITQLPAQSTAYQSSTVYTQRPSSSIQPTYQRPSSSIQATCQKPSYSGVTNTKEIPKKKKELCSIMPVVKSDISFILEYIDSYAQELNWDIKNYSEQSVYFVQLDWDSTEWSEVEDLFRDTNKRCFQIVKIERIQNPFLLAAFLLKQEEMESRIGEQDIENLFHGTQRENVEKICIDNLDYRLYGKNIGNKFGQGISFTPISNYATYYANDDYDNRVMLLVHVLTGSECIGKPNMILPDDGTDTSIKENGHVIVKYEDNEFYPAYKITYNCTDPGELQRRVANNKPHRNRRRKRNNHFNSFLYDDEY